MMRNIRHNDTIAAVATGQGGAIAVIRLSGGEAIAVADRVFVSRRGGLLADAAGYTVHFGEIKDTASGGETVDEVLATVFRAPHSYTGEDSVEISCHASPYITNRIMQLLLAAGARAATAGEFTVRAFLAGKLDLAEAEAVADLIASTDRAQHRIAIDQMKGGISTALMGLRTELVELAALLELELDFGEEDVEFASRPRLAELAGGIEAEINRLVGSFSLGNAIREGIPVAIVGRPNAGKSTLLNALVGDDRAMVSEIAGTTRDRIEERVNIGGVGFRFIDTAGLRATDDVLERMGIDRTLDAVARARIILLVLDGGAAVSAEEIALQVAELSLRDDQRLCVVVNKIDSASSEIQEQLAKAECLQADGVVDFESVSISAKTGRNLDALTAWLSGAVDTGTLEAGGAIVSNARHYEALILAKEAIGRVSAGIASGRYPDLLAEDIREVLYQLGTITGEVTPSEILGTIFSRFCIGK